MSTLALSILFSICFSSVFAQTINVSQADAIRATDGTCLTATATTDSSGVTLEKCDRDLGQQWTLSTSGRHIQDQGFALIILAGTSACLDSAAVNASHPGLYSCGGLPGGIGNASVNQAFSYSTLKNSRGPLVFIPLSGWSNNGVGPGQKCLSASQGRLDIASCDPASPSAEQQFYLGFDTTTTQSVTSSAASATASQSGAKRRSSVSPIAIAVPIVIVALLLLLLGYFLVRRYSKAKKESKGQKLNVQAARPFMAEPSTIVTSSTPTSSPQTSRRMKGELASINTSASTSPLPVVSSGLASLSMSASASLQQPADIDQNVSMIATRIDDPRLQHPQTINTTTSQTGAHAAFDRPTDNSSSLTRTATTSPPITSSPPPQEASNVNIDTILTLLAARVDPAYREQVDVRDSRDGLPSYQVPPSYHE